MVKTGSLVSFLIVPRVECLPVIGLRHSREPVERKLMCTDTRLTQHTKLKPNIALPSNQLPMTGINTTHLISIQEHAITTEAKTSLHSLYMQFMYTCKGYP